MSGQGVGSFTLVPRGAQGRGLLLAGTVCGRQNRARDAVGLDLCASKALWGDAAPREDSSVSDFRHCGQSQLQAAIGPGLSQSTEGLMPTGRRSETQSTDRVAFHSLGSGLCWVGYFGAEGGAHLILFLESGFLFFVVKPEKKL